MKKKKFAVQIKVAFNQAVGLKHRGENPTNFWKAHLEDLYLDWLLGRCEIVALGKERQDQLDFLMNFLDPTADADFFYMMEQIQKDGSCIDISAQVNAWHITFSRLKAREASPQDFHRLNLMISRVFALLKKRVWTFESGALSDAFLEKFKELFREENFSKDMRLAMASFFFDGFQIGMPD